MFFEKDFNFKSRKKNKEIFWVLKWDQISKMRCAGFFDFTQSLLKKVKNHVVKIIDGKVLFENYMLYVNQNSTEKSGIFSPN